MEPFSAGSWDVPYLGGARAVSSSSEEDISAMWLELHGSNGWVDLLDPLHPSLRAEVLKYGTFAQATYDAYDFDPLSKYCGSCRYDPGRLLDKVGLGGSGYDITSCLYATMTELPDLPLPPLLKNWLQRSLRIDSWSEDSNWMGFVAVSNGEQSRRLGRRDILVAWRGSMEPSEWYKDVQWSLEPLELGGGSGAMVQHGFHSVYTSRSSRCEYSKSSASEQVLAEIRRLVDKYCRERKEAVSLTITGHSLGGSLALLSAHEAAAAAIPGLSHVSVISFGAPQVGNATFGDELGEAGVKVLRVVIKQDMVPGYPGHLVNSRYQHTGVELHLDMGDQPGGWLESLNVLATHSMMTYLRLLGYLQGSSGEGSADAARVPLADVPSERREDALRARESWYRMANMGLLQGPPGWAWQEREPEDVPSLPRDDGDAPSQGSPGGDHQSTGWASAFSHFLTERLLTLLSWCCGGDRSAPRVVE